MFTTALLLLQVRKTTSGVKKPRRKTTVSPKSFRKMLIDDKSPQKDKKDKDFVVEIAWERLRVTRKHVFFVIKILSYLFAACAAVCFVIAFNMYIMRTFPLAQPVHVTSITGKRAPSEIVIKDVGIDLPILPATYSNKTFQTTSQGASYLTSSPLPGKTGNSIIYAHNWSNLFGNLVHVRDGEKVSVIFTDNSTETFTIVQTQTVHAYQTDILNPSTDKRLTLFTCENFLDADRFVATAIADNK